MPKRRILRFVLLLLAFGVGFAAAGFLLLRRQIEMGGITRDSVRALQQRVYEAEPFYEPKYSEAKERRATFDPANSKATLTLSYLGGMDGSVGGTDLHFELRGDGQFLCRDHAETRLLTVLDPGRCKAFFHRVLDSGILNYSEDVISLKKDLSPDRSSRYLLDNPVTQWHISVPELEIDKKIWVDSPKTEAEVFPDIVEFQILLALEKELKGLAPE